MSVRFHVSHWQCDLYIGETFIARMPGTVGQAKTKSTMRRVQHRILNRALARLWAKKIAKGGTRYNAPLHAVFYEKKIEHPVEACV